MMLIGETNSLGITRELNRTQSLIAKSLERLASGKRINFARDDLAGFAQAQGLDAQIRGLTQVGQALNQAQGFLQTASSAIQTQTEIVQRMRELSVQASNGLLSENDRQSLNNELTSLRDEFVRITNTTEFADMALLNGSFQNLEILLSDDPNSSFALDISDLSGNEVFEKTVGTSDFETSSSFSGGDGDFLRKADIDGDGDIDVIASSASEDSYTVFLNNGVGGFDFEQTTFSDSEISESFELADVNDDGKLDLVGVSLTEESIVVLLGNGDGTFGEETTFSSGEVSDIAIGDFDGDGNLDVASVGTAADRVFVHLNDGQGGFSSFTTFATGSEPIGIEAGDLDGDGLDDLYVANFDDENAEIYTSDGDGTFSLTDILNSIEGPEGDIFLVDLDNDGDLDSVAQGDSDIYIGINDGTGNFAQETYFALGSDPELEVADINNDGSLDIIGSPDNPTNTVTFLMNEGDGTFGQESRSDGLENDLDDIVAADFDNDGVIDLFTVDKDTQEYQVLESFRRLEGAFGELSLLSQETAVATTRILDNALNRLLDEQSSIASLSSKLESAANSNLILSESLIEAKTGIEAADFATETAELVASQILQQAQVAALSQANSQLQVVLGILPRT